MGQLALGVEGAECFFPRPLSSPPRGGGGSGRVDWTQPAASGPAPRGGIFLSKSTTGVCRISPKIRILRRRRDVRLAYPRFACR